MRLQRRQYDTILANEWVAKGMADHKAGVWVSVANDDHATLYEIGRLIAADLQAGAVKFANNTVEVDGFDIYLGSDWHAKIGRHIEPWTPYKKDEQF